MVVAGDQLKLENEEGELLTTKILETEAEMTETISREFPIFSRDVIVHAVAMYFKYKSAK